MRRAGAVLLTVTLAVVGVTACSKESAAARAERLVLGAADATFGEGTAQVLIALDGFGDGTGQGQVDFASGQSQTTVDLPDGPATVVVDGADILVVLDDLVTLVNPDQLDVLGRLRLLLLLLSPANVVHLLNGLTGDIDIVGDDTVDGVDTTHYALRVDVDAVLDSLADDDRAATQALLDAFGRDQFDIDVWIDDDGRLIQFQTDVDLGHGRLVSVTLGYRDFGTDVHLDIPDATDVLDAQEFGLATADISGHWSGQTETISSTGPGQFSGNDIQLDLRCRPDGSCVDASSGETWHPGAPGTWTRTDTVTDECIDGVTGVAVPGAVLIYEEHGTWSVTAYDERGRATAMTETGTGRAEATPEAVAAGCAQPGEGIATVRFEGTVTRT